MYGLIKRKKKRGHIVGSHTSEKRNIYELCIKNWKSPLQDPAITSTLHMRQSTNKIKKITSVGRVYLLYIKRSLYCVKRSLGIISWCWHIQKEKERARNEVREKAHGHAKLMVKDIHIHTILQKQSRNPLK